MTRSRKNFIKVYSLIALVFALGLVGCFQNGCESDPDRYLVFDTLSLIEDNYVHADRVQSKFLLEQAFRGIAMEMGIRVYEKEKELEKEQEKANPPEAIDEESEKIDTESVKPKPEGEDEAVDEKSDEKKKMPFTEPEDLLKKAPFTYEATDDALTLNAVDQTLRLDYPEGKQEMIDQFFKGMTFLIQALALPQPDPDLMYAGINGMVSSLDPHSSFLSPKICNQLRQETSGIFAGVGIEISIRRDKLTVNMPLEGTPAFESGIKPNDHISGIDGKSTLGMSLMEAVDLIRGKVGTQVVLSVIRKDVPDPIDFPLIRAKIDENSIKAKLLPGGIGHIRLYKFNGKTRNDLDEAIQKLVDKNGPLRGLIIDMRGNPGGLLDQAIAVADKFLERGLIVKTMGRGRQDDKNRFFAFGRDTERDLPLIVLINLQSASGSEIVAGALQDHERALLLGTRSFGKGSVQSIFRLNQNACLRLTTALYYTPSDRSIQATGIVPDIAFLYPKEEEELLANYSEKALKNHLDSSKADPNATAEMTFEIERIFDHYKKTGEVVVDPDDPEKSDWLLIYAQKIFAGENLTFKGMLDRSKELLSDVPELPEKPESETTEEKPAA